MYLLIDNVCHSPYAPFNHLVKTFSGFLSFAVFYSLFILKLELKKFDMSESVLVLIVVLVVVVVLVAFDNELVLLTPFLALRSTVSCFGIDYTPGNSLITLPAPVVSQIIECVGHSSRLLAWLGDVVSCA